MPATSKLNPLSLPKKLGEHSQFGQLIGASYALTCADIIQKHDGLVVIITTDMQQSLQLNDMLSDFSPHPVTLLSDWEVLPYDFFSPHTDIISDRLACLYQLPSQKKGALILPINTLMQKVCPHEFIQGRVLMMKTGQHIAREELRRQLEHAGYRAVEQVITHGEFATRGALFDLFPMGSNLPYRLDFIDDEIDSIRTFDPDTQRTCDNITQINLLPKHEFPTDPLAIELFRKQWRERFDVRRDDASIYQQVSNGVLPSGIEFWQPLFFSEPLPSLFSYFPSTTLLLLDSKLDTAAEQFWQNITTRYDSYGHDTLRPLIDPSMLWSKPHALPAEYKKYPYIILSTTPVVPKINRINIDYQPLPSLQIQHQHKVPLLALQAFSLDFSGALIFIVESEGRKEALQTLLRSISITPIPITQLDHAADSGHFILIGACNTGFIDNTRHRAIICENDLTQRHITQPKQRQSSRVINTDNLIRNLMELRIGQPIVHLEHGVGRYMGMTTLETGGIKAEYLILVYANETKLYVPISSLHMVSRYLGGAEENAPLNRLGTDSWSKSRQKAAERVRDIAAELLDIYASREAKKGFSFQLDEALYNQFCQTFPYELTPDQSQAIDSVIGDMCSGTAMDRLICGDVGFGKTEVAIRAAFLALLNKKQVAILVPTTLLAQQHFENLSNRFSQWPVHIEMISRFRTAKEQKLILQQVEAGKVDILIGTHKLLQNSIKWQDLGLLVVDEEHRFGVRQKERIKAIRADVDILTLTATPIPRTLNMAMHGIRDLSIIATPPARRLAVKTFIREDEPHMIREAILRESLRGGQIYYVYNDIDRIVQAKERLEKLVPEIRIGIGHGQMNERQLEQVMNDFYHHRINLLLCTTIIETGIDIPTANTIIIERADRFGLAQLHQLRGRVGRSHHQAYAYFLVPPAKMMSADAKKRLDAIASIEELGAGFALATHDLEIRGAGELLGEDQSGQITTIGFNLYMELLDNAVNALKSGKEPSLETLLANNQTDVDLRLPILIPDDYIADVNTRLSFYKRIASTKRNEELNSIRIELIDRFGLLPDSVNFLFDTTQLRQRAQTLGIKQIELNDKGGFVEFGQHHTVSVSYLIELIQKKNGQFRLENSSKLKITVSLVDRLARIQFICALLDDFSQHQEPLR